MNYYFNVLSIFIIFIALSHSPVAHTAAAAAQFMRRTGPQGVKCGTEPNHLPMWNCGFVSPLPMFDRTIILDSK